MPEVSNPARDIFLLALDRATTSERAEFIRQACGSDADLRQHVEALLRVHDEPDSLLDRSRFCLGAPYDCAEESPATIDQPRLDVGTIVGPYKLLEQIGVGGMGLVYMAEQQRPLKRLVALKIIKPGMDSRQVVTRFEAERQALAMMDHPNIAKILDAGTTDTGLPYFVMELVRGIPITDFCDQKRLSVRERLQLFLQVCQSVQHAHQKAIIHRDLKPTNVLVTMHDTQAVPKVIDFGIAKALGQSLTDGTLHTGFAQLVGTPLYMSPEQAEMNALGVDTRSDVYSLGVLLYELLTGTTPFDKETLTKAGFDEMRRMIREDEPPRPSARVSTLEAQRLSTISQHRSTDRRRITGTLNGELDWIVMKSLEKDRNRRYESASAFAADVQRYLDDEPVLACPPSTLYRLSKFTRRYLGTLVTAGIIALALLVGTAVATWQAIRATQAQAVADEHLVEVDRQRQQAQIHLQAANQARELANNRLAEVERERTLAQQNFDTALAGVDRMLSQVGTRQGALPLPEPTRRRLLADALALYDRLVEQRGDSLEARTWAAATSSRVAKLWQQIDERKAAHRAHLRAVELYERLAADDPTPDVRGTLATAISELAWFSVHVLHDHERAAELFRRVGDICEALELDAQDAATRKHFAVRRIGTMNGLCSALINAGRHDEALATNAKVLQLAIGDDFIDSRMNALKFKADLIAGQSPSEADSLYKEAVALSRRWVAQAKPGDEKFRRSHFARRLATVASFLATRDSEEASELLAESADLLKQLAKEYPGDPDFSKRHISVLEQQASVLRLRAREAQSDEGGIQNNAEYLAEAEGLINEAASVRRRLAAGDPTNPNRHALVDIMVDEARELRRTAAKTSSEDPSNAAELLAKADRQFREAMTALRERADASSEPAHRERLIPLLREQALFLRQQAAGPAGKDDPEIAARHDIEATARLREAASLAKALATEHPDTTNYKHLWAECLCDLAHSGDDQVNADAVAELRRLTELVPTDVRCRDLLCQVMLRTGRQAEALQELGTLITTHSALPAEQRAAHFTMRAAVLEKLGKLDLAIEDYSRAIELNPIHLPNYAGRGRLYAQLERDESALADYTSYLAQKPADANVLRDRGDIYVRTKKYDLADADFLTILNRNSNAYWISKRRAIVCIFKEDYRGALENLRQAVGGRPQDLTNITWMPLTAIAKSRDGAFRTDFLALVDRVVELNDASAEALVARALIAAELGMEDRSREDVVRAVDAEGELSYYTAYQAALLALHYDEQDAYQTHGRQMLQRFATSDKPMEQHFSVWTCALGPAALDDYAPAIELARKCVAQMPDDGQSLSGLGVILYRAGQYDAAIEELEKALAAAAHPKSSPAYVHFFLAMVHQQLGQTENAHRWLETALKAKQNEIETAADAIRWNRNLTLKLLHTEAMTLVTGSDGGK